MAIILPNSLSTQIRAHAPPIVDNIEAHRTKRGHNALHQQMESQKLNAHNVSTLQGKLLTPDKEEDGHTQGHLFCFSLSSFPHFTFLP
jgi:hypothetical protein